MTKQEFNYQWKEYKREIDCLKDKIRGLETAYCEDVLKRNGYNVGDKIEKDGKVGIIMGSEIFAGMVKLIVNKIKSDGTPSFIRDRRLEKYLKEE